MRRSVSKSRGTTGRSAARTAKKLPPRGEFVIRNAYVLTMDPELGDIPGGDVHVKNGEIVAVGRRIKAPRAAVLDGRSKIVLPGLIDTHWHMWTTFLRCMAGDRPEQGYFPVTTSFGRVMTPEDMYRSTRLAAAEAIYSGITTVCDNCHNVRSPDHARADIRALAECGLRARFYYGGFRGMPPEQGIDMGDVERLHREWAKYSNEGRLTLGLAWGGVGSLASPLPPGKLATARGEFEAARRMGIPMAVHLSARENTTPGEVEAYARGSFLGKDVLLLHVLSATRAEMKMIAAAGSPISVSPGSELRIGYGLTKTCDFLEAGIVVGVSVDTVPLTGNASLLGVLKLLRNAENAKAFDEFKISARRVLELGTMGGARCLGLDHVAGSLTPGKRADLIMVSTDALNMGVFTDPTHMLVEATEPANIDMVMVDGRILKRGGKLTALTPGKIIAAASASLEAARKRANWR